MFTYLDAFVKLKEPRGRWVDKDLGSSPIRDLLNEYQEVVLKLSHILYEEPQALNLKDVPSYLNFRHYNGTVIQWLESLGNAGLPVTPNFPNLDCVYAVYSDAALAGFDLKPINSFFHHSMDLQPGDLCDLRMTRYDVDYKKMYDTCLVSINGLFHRTNFVGDGLHILEANKSRKIANDNLVGVYDLSPLGNIKIVPIWSKRVHKESEDQPLSTRAIIEIDNSIKDLDKKTVLISIGGYLHLPDNKTIKRVGTHSYRIDFKDYPILQRYFEMEKLIDISKIKEHLRKSNHNDGQVVVEQLLSNGAIEGLLTLSQSFFVIIDTPEVFLDLRQLEFNGLPGSYITHHTPIYPITLGLGRFYEYWPRHQYDRYAIMIKGGVKDNYLAETTHWKELSTVDDSRLPYNPMSYQPIAKFFKLGKYKD